MIVAQVRRSWCHNDNISDDYPEFLTNSSVGGFEHHERHLPAGHFNMPLPCATLQKEVPPHI